jgi:hypothetical protein
VPITPVYNGGMVCQDIVDVVTSNSHFYSRCIGETSIGYGLHSARIAMIGLDRHVSRYTQSYSLCGLDKGRLGNY